MSLKFTRISILIYDSVFNSIWTKIKRIVLLLIYALLNFNLSAWYHNYNIKCVINTVIKLFCSNVNEQWANSCLLNLWLLISMHKACETLLLNFNIISII